MSASTGQMGDAMSLPTSQQRVLERIENRLRDSDPRLTALFVIFTRLTRDEEMPGVEELRARLVRLRAWASWHTAPIRRVARRRSERIRAIVFFPVALAAMACALLIGAGPPSGQRCGPALKKAPAAELIVKARQCKLNLNLHLGMMRTPILGH
jgi:hypothetical protein